MEEDINTLKSNQEEMQKDIKDLQTNQENMQINIGNLQTNQRIALRTVIDLKKDVNRVKTSSKVFK